MRFAQLESRLQRVGKNVQIVTRNVLRHSERLQAQMQAGASNTRAEDRCKNPAFWLWSSTKILVRRVLRVQMITVVWMSVEAGISLLAAWRARSPALLAFGGDSAIELLSAVVVLWRFRSNVAQERAERRAALRFDVFPRAARTLITFC